MQQLRWLINKRSNAISNNIAKSQKSSIRALYRSNLAVRSADLGGLLPNLTINGYK